MKTLGIDLRCVPPDGSDGAGVAHAARFLTRALIRTSVDWKWVLFFAGAAMVDNGECEKVMLSDQSGSSFRCALRHHPCDILFVPHGACAPFIPIPQIPWVHDLAIFDHPEWFPQSVVRRLATTRFFARGLKHAPIIFSVSECTKRDIVRHVGIDPGKISVTYEGGDPNPRDPSRPPLKQGDRILTPPLEQGGMKGGSIPRFCLAIGTVEPRKNFEMLFSIWDDVYRATGCELRLVGERGWGAVDMPNKKYVHWMRGITDDEKQNLIRSAELVLVPSWFEGFGLVALEAMYAGTAVIASDRGAHPEVVGDGGILIPPDDPEAWKKAIIRLLFDRRLRGQSAAKGHVRSQRFTWKKTADIITSEMKKHLR